MPKHVVSTSLVVCYSLLAVYVLAQLVLLFREKHKRTGFKAIFNYLTLVWCALRAIFWLLFVLDQSLAGIGFYLLFWLPQCVQYLTFALLAVFLTKLVLRDSWGMWRLRVFGVFGAVAVFDVAGTIALSVLAANATDDDAADRYGNAESLGTAVIFLLLSFVFALLSLRLRALSAVQYSRMFLFKPRVIGWVTLLLFAVFASRSTVNFLTFAGVVDINIDKDDLVTDVSAAAAYGFWEFFPVLLLLSTIASAPRTAKFAVRRRGGGAGAAAADDDEAASLFTFGVFGAISAFEAAQERGEAGDGVDGEGDSERPASPSLIGGSGGGGNGNDVHSRYGGNSGGGLGAPGGLGAAGGLQQPLLDLLPPPMPMPMHMPLPGYAVPSARMMQQQQQQPISFSLPSINGGAGGSNGGRRMDGW